MDPAFGDLAVDIVLGLQSPHRQAVEELVARRPNTTLYDPLPSLAALITRADLAIGAGGTTTWERACLGLPSLVIAIAANQLETTEALGQEGCLFNVCLRDFEVQMKYRLRMLISQPESLLAASARSVDFVDGLGVNIVCSQIIDNE